MDQLWASMITMAWDATKLALALVRATMEQLDKEVRFVATTQTNTRHTIQEISDALDTVVDRVGDALEARLVEWSTPRKK